MDYRREPGPSAVEKRSILWRRDGSEIKVGTYVALR